MKKRLFFLALLLSSIMLVATFSQTALAVGHWKAEKIGTGVVDPTVYYHLELQNLRKIWHLDENLSSGNIYSSLKDLLIAEVAGITSQTLSGLSAAEIKEVAHGANVTYYVTEIEGLTDQIWAVQVNANPRESGSLRQDFEAAYGPYGGLIADSDGSVPSGEEDKWFFQPDQDGKWQTTIGKDYVGNYFHMDQVAYTSDGTIKRYISISSPWSHAFLEEDMSVVGRAEISDAFVIQNLAPGAEIKIDWRSLF